MAGKKVATGGNGKKRVKPKPKKKETMIATGGRGKQRKRRG